MTTKRREKIDRVLNQRQGDLTVLAESLHKPRNLSAIVRSCDAVGINEMHAIPGDDGLAIHWRTSQGAEKWVGVRAHEDLSSACAWLRSRGFRLVAANLSDGASDYRDLDYTSATALLVGTELFGVSEAAQAEADAQVKIPMVGMTQSLNVSVACAIVLFEAMRQRQAAGLYGRRRIDDETWKRQRFEWMHPQLTEFCRKRGLDYPELDESGEVVGDFPRA